jgi:hypothetical protein
MRRKRNQMSEIALDEASVAYRLSKLWSAMPPFLQLPATPLNQHAVHSGAGLFLTQTSTPPQVAAEQPVGQVRVAAAFFFVFFFGFACLSVLAAGASCAEDFAAAACGTADAAAVSAAQAGRVNIKALNNSMYFMVMLPLWLKKSTRFSCTYQLPLLPIPETGGRTL